MANANKGEVSIECGGKVYTLSFSVNAMCAVEDHFGGKPIGEIVAAMDGKKTVPMKTVRAMVWAGFQDHHDGMTLKQAGAIMSEVGIPAMIGKIGRAFELAFPAAEGGTGENPPEAKAG